MSYLKKLSFWLLLSYSIQLFIREPKLSDSLIILCLSALFGYECYLNGKKVEKLPLDSREILENELQEEQLKLKIHETKAEYMRKSASKIAGGQNVRPVF